MIVATTHAQAPGMASVAVLHGFLPIVVVLSLWADPDWRRKGRLLAHGSLDFVS